MNGEANDVYRSALLNLRAELRAGRGRAGPPWRNGVTLEQVDAALMRLERGTYGYCQRCFLVIPQADLLRRPYLEQCRVCQARPQGCRLPQPGQRARQQEGGPSGMLG